MKFVTYYYLEESLKNKLKALGLAGLTALSTPVKADDVTVSFKLPTKTYSAQDKKNDVSEVDIVAATLFKEARGEGIKGMQAVNEVIANRAKTRKKTKAEICLQPKQFSCWNGITPSKEVINKLQQSEPKMFALAKKIAQETVTNHTNGAEYYHTTSVSPKWGRNLKEQGYKIIKIGNHLFYYSS